MAWYNRTKKTTELRSDAKASDSVEADHWIVSRIEGMTSGSYSVAGDDALKQTTVYACIRVLAETIASLPCVLYRRGPNESKEPALDHPLYTLLHDAPNNFQTAFEFQENSVGSECLRGNSYSFIERNKMGEILRIIPLNPDKVKPVMTRAPEYVLAYEIKDADGKVELFHQNNIWHQKGLTRNGYLGVSPIQMSRDAIVLSGEAERHGITYYQNGARSSGIAKIPGRLTPAAKDRLKDSLQAGMSGSNKFKVMVFEGGMEWQQLTLTNEDSQYLETRRFQVEEIARIFRVPTILIGHPDKASTYASAEQFMMSFATHTVRPWLVRKEQSANMSLLTPEERKEYFVKYKLDALLRGDTTTRYSAYATARQGRWMSANEIRALEDMNPIEGGDQYDNPSIDVKPPDTKKPDNGFTVENEDENQDNE